MNATNATGPKIGDRVAFESEGKLKFGTVENTLSNGSLAVKLPQVGPIIFIVPLKPELITCVLDPSKHLIEENIAFFYDHAKAVAAIGDFDFEREASLIEVAIELAQAEDLAETLMLETRLNPRAGAAGTVMKTYAIAIDDYGMDREIDPEAVSLGSHVVYNKFLDLSNPNAVRLLDDDRGTNERIHQAVAFREVIAERELKPTEHVVMIDRGQVYETVRVALPHSMVDEIHREGSLSTESERSIIEWARETSTLLGYLVQYPSREHSYVEGPAIGYDSGSLVQDMNAEMYAPVHGLVAEPAVQVGVADSRSYLAGYTKAQSTGVEAQQSTSTTLQSIIDDRNERVASLEAQLAAERRESARLRQALLDLSKDLSVVVEENLASSDYDEAIGEIIDRCETLAKSPDERPVREPFRLPLAGWTIGQRELDGLASALADGLLREDCDLREEADRVELVQNVLGAAGFLLDNRATDEMPTVVDLGLKDSIKPLSNREVAVIVGSLWTVDDHKHDGMAISTIMNPNRSDRYALAVKLVFEAAGAEVTGRTHRELLATERDTDDVLAELRERGDTAVVLDNRPGTTTTGLITRYLEGHVLQDVGRNGSRLVPASALAGEPPELGQIVTLKTNAHGKIEVINRNPMIERDRGE